ncbi:MAG: 2-amino-4-hydroxy-6-hydroxymethyldihydropteridine diphosphokinase, partial [Muribaculaceae bacterium]|nr:2-amino-4-hydroxy-6-hydroxymethyldihydropteridine diphosphokinase [Muribaculaceae bacterium]
MACYLNIGSNLGDRLALIEQAVALLRKALPDCGIRLSDYIETEPWGYESTNRFLNLGVAIDGYGGTPLDLLALTQAVERQVADAPHRHADGTYRDRPIDIDIIAIDGVALSTPE